MSKSKIAVFIGRFQPFHNGHLSILEKASKEFDKVIVLVGSANRRSSIKNPFSPDVRMQWIESIASETLPTLNIRISSINDSFYNETKWETEVYYKVHHLADEAIEDEQISIIGFEKDDSSYYLHSFPQWKVRLYDIDVNINSTDLRNALFEAQLSQSKDKIDYFNYLMDTFSPVKIAQFFKDVEALYESYGLDDLVAEFKFYQDEAEKFKDYPYLDTLKFMCADMAVVCKGHVLLIQRKFAPGRNTWALPGGFVNQKETFQQTALRELMEETSIKVPKRALEGKIKAASQSIKTAKMFDDPSRSLGIPRVSMAYFIEVEPDHDGRLPKVKAADDALDAKWIPLASARNLKLFDDHSDMIDYFTGSM